MKTTIARVAGSPASQKAALDLAERSLVESDREVATVVIPSRGLPADIDDEHRRLVGLFALTPGALMESWRVACHLSALTAPGDTVLISDYRGLGGVFALEQSNLSREQRRSVWTLAGESVTLAHLETLQTLGGYEGEIESAVDWELVQYRFSDAVLSPALRGVDVLSSIGVEAVPMPVPVHEVTAELSDTESKVWLPEVVSRKSRTPAIIRAIESHLEERTDLTVVVCADDEQDEIWEGMTWSRVAPVAERHGGRIGRDSRDPGGIIVLGSTYAVPGEEVLSAYTSGRTVVVPVGSTAAAMMPGAVTWTNEDDLGEALSGGTKPTDPESASVRSWPTLDRLEDPTRARAVSVGIPIYRDIRFLDECIQSVLDQTQQPREVVLFDDGSSSPDVDAAVDGWQERHPDLFRVMRGPNRGVCVARNKMLEAMTGDAFLLVDSDDLLHPDFIEACAKTLRSSPELTAVATWTEFFGGYNGVEAKPPFDARVGLRENPIVSTAVLVDMSIRDHGIRFAPDLAFLYCEDWHVWSQIVAGGGALGLVPRVLVQHRVHPSSGATKRTALAHTVGRARATQPIRAGDLP